jgi:hypothetical protein
MGFKTSNPLIQSLQNKAIYRHEVKEFNLIETHISWVILTGVYAYKIKKPIHLGFLDFTTLEKRHFFCQEELRLNQILAPELYINVVPISGTLTHPQMNGTGTPIEYAVQMHQFNQEGLLTHLVEKKSLSAALVNELASQIANFHLQAKSAAVDSRFASPSTLRQAIEDNFSTCKTRVAEPEWQEKLNTIEQWTHTTFHKNESILTQRKQQGYTKDCHGDLHLGNIVYEHHKITIFDRIEFNDDFRIIDVLDEIAFLTMDFKAKKHFFEAYQLLNCYLEITGDYENLNLWMFYEVYRAMVRAKICLLQENPEKFKTYIDLALQLLKPQTPRLMITHGLPGSGKSYLTQHLAPPLSAIYLRSDIERKRIFGSKNNIDLYTEANSDIIYQHLATLAHGILSNGFSVIIDATFLQYKHRKIFNQLAQQLHIPFIILNCLAEPKTIAERLEQRSSSDASDANLQIAQQLNKKREHLTENELKLTLPITMDQSLDVLQLIRNNIFR